MPRSKKRVILAHGTSKECAENILANGFGRHGKDKIWLASMASKTYFAKIDPDDDWGGESLSKAAQASQIAAAHYGSNYGDTVILLLEMSEKTFEQYFDPDSSCENTGDDWEISDDMLNELIASKKIALRPMIAENLYIPYLRPWYLAYMVDNDYYVFKDPLLEKAARIINDNDKGLIADELLILPCLSDLKPYGANEREAVLTA